MRHCSKFWKLNIINIPLEFIRYAPTLNVCNCTANYWKNVQNKNLFIISARWHCSERQMTAITSERRFVTDGKQGETNGIRTPTDTWLLYRHRYSSYERIRQLYDTTIQQFSRHRRIFRRDPRSAIHEFHRKVASVSHINCSTTAIVWRARAYSTSTCLVCYSGADNKLNVSHSCCTLLKDTRRPTINTACYALAWTRYGELTSNGLTSQRHSHV